MLRVTQAIWDGLIEPPQDVLLKNVRFTNLVSFLRNVQIESGKNLPELMFMVLLGGKKSITVCPALCPGCWNLPTPAVW